MFLLILRIDGYTIVHGVSKDLNMNLFSYYLLDLVMNYRWIMNEYLNIKITEEKIKSLKKALKSRGIKARSNAEAVNILIDNFLLNSEYIKPEIEGEVTP